MGRPRGATGRALWRLLVKLLLGIVGMLAGIVAAAYGGINMLVRIGAPELDVPRPSFDLAFLAMGMALIAVCAMGFRS